MEESLIGKDREQKPEGLLKWASWSREVKRIGYIAGPVIPVLSSQFFLQIIAIMMAGHLDKLSLSGTALAISIAGVTGFSFLVGMASGLETLCGQAYGAKQYKKLGVLTYTATFSLILICIPLSLVWINMEKILVFIGQDPLISHEAGKFTTWLIPSLFGFAFLQPLIRYYQMQSLVLPMLISSCTTLILYIPLCWALVFKTGLNSVGAAVAINISIWANVIVLALHMTFSSTCAKTRAPISMELFSGIGEFLRFAVPSAVMMCLEWWSFELLILLSGLLPNPQLETSVLSVCLNTLSTLYTIPYGIGAAASTRISNELGAGNPDTARVAVVASMSLAALETTVISATLFFCRGLYGYIFSNEKEVIDYVTVMAPLVCVSVILDGLQGVLTGIARGCGWQHIGAYINLGAYYLCGIPVAATLSFWLKLGGKGLWIGIQFGCFVQTLLLSIITCRINWKQQAINARRRLFEEQFAVENGLVSSSRHFIYSFAAATIAFLTAAIAHQHYRALENLSHSQKYFHSHQWLEALKSELYVSIQMDGVRLTPPRPPPATSR